MIIILSPLASEHTTTVSINGLVITVDGTEYDLSVIPEGGSAEASEDSPFIGTLTRDKVTVKYHYDMAKAEENQSTNWDDYTFSIESGDAPCPIKWKPEQALAAETFAEGLVEALELAGYNKTQIAAMSWEEKMAALEKEGYNVEQIKEWGEAE